MKERIDYIDSAKGILIIMMLIGHIWSDGFVRDFIYTFHMPAFFVISGVLFNKSSAMNRSFLCNFLAKIRTLLVPYLSFEIFAILIDIVLNGVTLNIKGYMYEILMLHLYNGPLWFLFVMFLSELLFLLFYRWIDCSLKSNFIFALLLILIMLLPKFPQYINMATTILGLFFLLVGYVFYIAFTSESIPMMLMALLITIFVSIVNVGSMPDYQDGNRILFLCGSIAGSYFVLQISRLISSPVLRFYGKNSIIILGSHYPILRLIRRVFSIGVFSGLSGMACLTTILLIEVPIIHVINHYFPFLIGRHQQDYPKKNIYERM